MAKFSLKRKAGKYFRNALGHIYPKALCSYLYYKTFNKKINWKNPQTFNEWVCWLEFNSDTSLWTVLADKYRVRKWIEDKGLGECLPELYGVYADADKIDFAELPDKFVIKANNGCAQVIIVRDKKTIDEKQIKDRCTEWLKTPFGYSSAEPHYIKIPRKIIIEELLKTPDNLPLIDYKWFCFNGKPLYAQIVSERDFSQAHKFKLQVYDPEWNPHTEFLNRKELKNDVDRPIMLEKQLEICRYLSKGFPQMRVDLYEVNGKVYIGEITMTNAAGRDIDFSGEFDEILGRGIDRSVIKPK